MEYPRISIVFPILNGLLNTQECLASLAKLDYPKNKLEVIIIDNGSTDGSCRWIKTHCPKTTIIEAGKNLGFAKAVNLGIKKTNANYIFITNNDVVFDNNYFKELIKVFNINQKIAIAGGQILYIKPKGVNTIPGFRFNLWFGWHAYDLADLDKIREVEWFPGSAMLVKSEVFKKIGLFDDGYFFGSEDYDFCLRARRFSYKIYYTPKAVIYHGLATTAKKMKNSQRLYLNYQSKFRFMFKNASLLQMFTFFPTQLIIGPIISYWRFRYQTFFPMFRALIWNLKNLNQTLKVRRLNR